MTRAAAGFALVLLTLLGGAELAHARERPGTVGFDPELYFSGRTRAEGAFLAADGRPGEPFTGETRGRRTPDGATHFDQTIRFADGSVRQRSFRLVRTGPATIEVTGSEVVGVARGEINGRSLRLLSTIRADPGNPLSDVEFEQAMVLQPDGRSVTNRSVIRKFGFVVRVAEERFVSVDGARAARRPGR